MSHLSTTDKFSGKAELFPRYKEMIEGLLLEEDLDSLVDGSSKSPTPPILPQDTEKDDPAYLEKVGVYETKLREWTKKDNKAKRIISLHLSDDVYSRFKDTTTSAERWASILKAYESDSLTTFIADCSTFFSLHKQANEAAQAHLDRLRQLSRSIASTSAANPWDQIVGARVLDSLDSDYDGLRTAIATNNRDKLQDFDWLAKTILEHEQVLLARAMSSSVSAATNETALSMRRDAPRKKKSKSKAKRSESEETATDDEPAKQKYGSHDSRRWPPRKSFPPSKPNRRANPTEKTNATITGTSVGSVIVDSGATSSMHFNASSFETYTTLWPPIPVILGDGRRVDAIGRGSIILRSEWHGRKCWKTLYDVLHVPDLKLSLVSVPKLAATKHSVHFNQHGCLIRNKQGRVCLAAKLTNGLYQVDAAVHQSESANAVSSSSPPFNLWHKRLGHLGCTHLASLSRLDMVRGMPDMQKVEPHLCGTCQQGKQASLPFPPSTHVQATKPLELIHSDVCGPMPVPSLTGKRYMVTFIDHATRYTHVYFMHTKNQVADYFREFKAEVELLHGAKIKALRSDNGGEYIGKSLVDQLHEAGIQHQTTAPYAPQQNGIAERKNRTLCEMARCLLLQASLPQDFWAEALHTANYIVNRVSGKATPGTTPYESWFGHKPSLAHFKVFGCLAYTGTPKPGRTKWSARAETAIFLGYLTKSKAYRFYNPRKQAFFKSREVVFDEETMAVSVLDLEAKDDERHPVHFQVAAPPAPPAANNTHEPLAGTAGGQGSDREVTDGQDEASNTDDAADEIDTADEVDDAAPLRPPTPPNNAPAPADNPRYPRRERRPPAGRENFELAMVAAPSPDGSPRTHAEARATNDWRHWDDAMRDELASIRDCNVAELCRLPAGRRAIGSRWVFKRKLDPATRLTSRFKARLVAQGFSQRPGIDYNETYAPVVSYSTLRILFALSAIEDLELEQMDVKTAFLYGDLEEEVYMRQPPGYEAKGKEHLVWRLRKSIYGLKQSPRMWNAKITQVLISFGLRQSRKDPGVFYSLPGAPRLLVALYVDDILIAGKDKTQIRELKAALASNFKMSDLGPVKRILGINIERDRKARTISIDQSDYVKLVLERFSMHESKPVLTPSVGALPLNPDPPTQDELDEMAKVPYLSAVGSLQYAAMVTRPDIAQAVSYVAQYSAAPRREHWNAIKRILRYLRGTTGAKIVYQGKGNRVSITGYVDADHGSNPDGRRSVTGYCLLLAGAAILWSSRRQSVRAQSTAEAELFAVNEAAKEIVWARILLGELGWSCDKATPLHVDNSAALRFTKNRLVRSGLKHIDLKQYYIQDLVDQHTLSTIFCPTKVQVADCLTKGVDSKTLEFGRSHLGISLPKASGRLLGKMP